MATLQGLQLEPDTRCRADGMVDLADGKDTQDVGFPTRKLTFSDAAVHEELLAHLA